MSRCEMGVGALTSVALCASVRCGARAWHACSKPYAYIHVHMNRCCTGIRMYTHIYTQHITTSAKGIHIAMGLWPWQLCWCTCTHS